MNTPIYIWLIQNASHFSTATELAEAADEQFGLDALEDDSHWIWDTAVDIFYGREIQVHFRDQRLFLNAGISLPTCAADEALLDLDKGRWPMTSVRANVTCARCAQIAKPTVA